MSARTPAPGPSGVLIVDKPLRATSAGMCTLVKGRLKAGGAPKRVKVGHGGTLDPLATGVLVILVGKATRLSDRVMAGGKEYVATIDLSRVSPTDDLEGDTSPVEVERPPAEGDVRAACARFLGRILQRPPEHSAVKIGGERAYRLARAGEPTPVRARPVTIRAISLVRYQWPTAVLHVDCGKGVYIRSLARDLGVALGTGGVLTGLRRTRVGPFRADSARTPDQLPDPLGQADLIPLEDAERMLRQDSGPGVQSSAGS